jgi:hypothetical protein
MTQDILRPQLDFYYYYYYYYKGMDDDDGVCLSVCLSVCLYYYYYYYYYYYNAINCARLPLLHSLLLWLPIYIHRVSEAALQ